MTVISDFTAHTARARDRRRVLFVLHNHPTLHPGGAEAYALELYQALRAHPDFEPLVIARIGSNISTRRVSHPGTPFSAVNDDPNQYFVFTETEHFDFFLGTSRDKALYSKHFANFLKAHQPDIVHFHHTLFIGYDLILQTRFTLPKTPIVYTLHEYLPICHRDGQMVRTRGDELCRESSPRRCNECFPSISPQDFFFRKRFIQSHFEHVDLFLAPSQFLLERYVDWGIPRGRIRFEDYGRGGVEAASTSEERKRTRIGFFGQFNHFKGVTVLLRAMKLLGAEEPEAHLWLYGANLDLQTQDFQDEIGRLLEETRDNVTMSGKYDHTELPKLMANIDWVVVPSRWWENSPLVIQEAFLHGRPVICSDIGAMAEKVEHGVSGLHFRAGDPVGLAETLHRAISTRGLWETLRRGIPQIYSMEEHVEALAGIYDELVIQAHHEE